MTLNGTARTYATEATSNRLTSISNPTRGFGYDATGNTLSDTGLAYTTTYRLDGRMGAITKSGVTTTYSYDAGGQRVRKMSGSTVTHFNYDQGGQLLGQYSGTTPSQEFVWMGGIPVAVLNGASQDPEVLYVFSDHLGAPRVMIDKNNGGRWRWISEPFGTTTAEEAPDGLAPVALNLRFPGQYFDKESGLSYNYFRDYDGTTGRYVQSDPIGLEGGVNTFTYANGNAAAGIDPMGLATIVGAPPYGPNFGRPSKEYQDWWKRFGTPLQKMLDAMEQRIKTLCPVDRATLQKKFDEWIVRADPNIDNPIKRAKTGWATTKGNRTQFNWRHFQIEPGESPSQYFNGWHELRHTMPGNAAIIDPPGSFGNVLAGHPERVPSEVDADDFAEWFINSSNTCGCPK